MLSDLFPSTSLTSSRARVDAQGASWRGSIWARWAAAFRAPPFRSSAGKLCLTNDCPLACCVCHLAVVRLCSACSDSTLPTVLWINVAYAALLIAMAAGITAGNLVAFFILFGVPYGRRVTRLRCALHRLLCVRALRCVLRAS